MGARPAVSGSPGSGLEATVAGGQAVAAGGGPQTRVNRLVQAVCQGQPVGRCRTSRRAEDAIRAGTWTSWRRSVPVVALASVGPVRVPAARVRLKAMTARTSQAALAAKTPEGRWASAAFFRSA